MIISAVGGWGFNFWSEHAQQWSLLHQHMGDEGVGFGLCMTLGPPTYEWLDNSFKIFYHIFDVHKIKMVHGPQWCWSWSLN